MKYTIPAFLRDQFTRLPPPLQADLAGKTVLVTGANTGIGLEVAKHFARMQPKRLVVACRNMTKGLDAIARESNFRQYGTSRQMVTFIEIEKETKFKAEVLPVDQSDFSSVVGFVRAFGDGPLDIAVLNAGIATRVTDRTKDGWETTYVETCG